MRLIDEFFLTMDPIPAMNLRIVEMVSSLFMAVSWVVIATVSSMEFELIVGF